MEVIWRINAFPPNLADVFGFSYFAIELNGTMFLIVELTPDLEGMLPSTDTRYRTDQRLYEEGRIEEAEAEKLRLEQKQRETRREFEKSGKVWVPKYFEQIQTKSGPLWAYKNNYWDQRGKFINNYEIFK